ARRVRGDCRHAAQPREPCRRARPARARGERVPRVGARRVPRPRTRAGLDRGRRRRRRRHRCRTRPRRRCTVAGRMTGMVATDHWARIPGQDRAVVQLQRAASRPVHAYLLVGPRGSGIEEAARCFAAAVVAPDGNDRSWDLALRGVHPDVVEVDPPATQIRVEDAQLIVDEASRSPLEGGRKVILLFDAELLRLNEAAANKLLKTLEEPPPRAMIVLVTSGAD